MSEQTEHATPYLLAALYKFVRLEDFEALRPRLEERARDLGICGTLLLAREGINGTISGHERNLRTFLAFLKSDPRFEDLVHKESWSDEKPFLRLKVRLKKEIVTMGMPEVDPTEVVGTYVKPSDWNALIAQSDVVLVDTRNDYEVEIGTFKGAIDPQTSTFREFPQWSQEAPELKGKTKVAMFCTGGIRCEKASSYLKHQGVEEVYHLEGGILKYLEEVPKAESMWEGECFVFDGRVSVDHSLEPGEHVMCYGCRRPVSPAGRADERYIEGVCCPWCHDQLTPEQIERFRERHLQIQLAEERKELHLGREVRVKERKEPTLSERELPVLYSFRRCPYAIRARLALAATGTEVELREVVLRNKPHHMIELSSKATVPVLWKQDDSVLEESLDIMAWALHHSGDPQGWLQTPGEGSELTERLVAENDGPFKHHLDRYKYPDRYENVDGMEHRAAAEDFLRQLEERLGASPFLQGPAFGWADAAILPFIRQFANTDREWFDSAPYPCLQRWLKEGLESDLFLSVMKKYKAWEPSELGVRFPEPLEAG